MSADSLCSAAAFKLDETGQFIKASKEDCMSKQFNVSYNIPPTTIIPVIVGSEQRYLNSSAARIIIPMRFGLIPPWLVSTGYGIV